MTRSVKIAIVVGVLILAGSAAWGLSQIDTGGEHTHAPGTPEHTHDDQDHEHDEDQEVAATITYSNQGFSESTYTIKSGDHVKIINNSPSTLDFESDPHPVHTDQPQLNVGPVEPGKTAFFSVSDTGEWGFHNHLNETHTATLIVE